MAKYIDAEKLIHDLEERIYAYSEGYAEGDDCRKDAIETLLKNVKYQLSLQQEQDRMRYCIEYINPQYPLLYNGMLHVCHLRVPDEHSAEMALTLMLSLGAKIYALYRGNAKEGKLGEWPTPLIVDVEDWYSEEWLRDILDRSSKL